MGIYPTETFYALGCSALHSRACARVFDCKGRDQAKPLPVLIGGLEQLSLLTSWGMAELGILAERFWPGPLSVLLPARTGLPREIQNQHGEISLRWTSHPGAQRLCLEARSPLVATSANFSQQQPVAKPEALDPKLLQKADFVMDTSLLPQGGLPSTIVQIIGQGELLVLRPGAISSEKLQEAGFRLA